MRVTRLSGAQIEVARGFGARDLRVERAPLRARLAALRAEALLDADAAARPPAAC